MIDLAIDVNKKSSCNESKLVGLMAGTICNDDKKSLIVAKIDRKKFVDIHVFKVFNSFFV